MMSKKTNLKPLAAAVGAAVTGTLLVAGSVNAAENPFGMTEMKSGYMQLAEMEGKCGGNMPKAEEGKCGGKPKADEGKCGEAKCGANKAKPKAAEGKCGNMPKAEEGKCGGKPKAAEGKCGNMPKAEEGKCGGKPKAPEGKCGANK